MLNKGLGALASVAAVAAISALVGLSQGAKHPDWLWAVLLVGAVMFVVLGIGWLLTREDSGGPLFSISQRADHGGIVQTAGRDATAAGRDLTDNSVSGNITIINSFNESVAPDRTAGPVAVLEFSEPKPDDTVTISDSNLKPVAQVTLWRVELRNSVEGTKASNVSIELFRSTPELPVLPVDLHECHNDRKPYRQRHEVRFGDPILVDVIAKHRSEDEFYLWRSDLPDEYWTFIYPLSPPERDIILSQLHGDGVSLVLRATPDPPARYTEAHYVVRIDDAGRFVMEPEPIVLRPDPAVLRVTAHPPTVSTRPLTLRQRLANMLRKSSAKS